jgi:hypothetical protein
MIKTLRNYKLDWVKLCNYFYLMKEGNVMETDLLKKPTVLILGTFHMRPTTDMFQSKIDDLLSNERQQEIRDVVERIKQFNPTKVAIEVDTKQDKSINEEYISYIKGNFELEVNEVHQIGFRIASELNHNKIYPVDWRDGAGKRGAGEVYEWAKTHQPELFKNIFGWLETTKKQPSQSKPSILEMYRNCNDIEEVKQHHRMYINMACIGEIDNYVGMDWLIWWYQRNLILFSNIARISNSSDGRILLIIGSGHVQILHQFLEESGHFKLEWANKYLKE